MLSPEPMDIDAPSEDAKRPPPPPPTALMSEDDEARQAIDMLRGEDVSARVAAANRLEAVAAALGHERTRDELLPFLTDGVDDEDEVLVAIASSLGKLIEHVGGPSHAQALLPPLELLLSVEENTVRDAAAISAQAVADVLTNDVFQEMYATMIGRLATMEWFTARISAASLIAASYNRMTVAQQNEHVKYFAALCRDDTPMVRRIASQHLGLMLQVVVDVNGRSCFEQGGIVAAILAPLYEELASNEQPDSVRLQTTENCVAFGRVMSSVTDNGSYSLAELSLVNQLLPLIVATIDDRSWRVRWTAASKFADVISAFDKLPGVMDSLIPAYEKLLQDPEAEVRTAATFNLAAVAKCVTMVLPPPTGRANEDDASTSVRITVAERLVKRVTSLTEDDSEHVRAALAMVATELAPILGKSATITHLVPPVLLLLRDAASEVRLNLISSLSALNEVIGVDLLSQSLLPAILDLSQDGKWRIRLAIIKHIPLLAKQLGRDFFTDKLSSLCVGWLGDDISSIRMAAVANLGDLTELFGTDWAIEYLLPPIAEMRLHSSYLRRLTAVQACAMISTKMEPEIGKIELLPMVLELSTDSVANIRFNVAKGLEQMGPVYGQSVYVSQIRPVLNILIDDPDRDVRFFAEKSLKFLEGAIGSE